jgi:hypothetical protein
MEQERRSASTRIKATLENRPISDAIAVRSWSLATRESTPLRVEKRLRSVVPLGRNRVGPLPRNRVVPFRRNQVGPITRNPAVDRSRRRSLATDDFNKRYQVGRIERVAEHDALSVAAAVLELGDFDTGRAGCENRTGVRSCIHGGKCRSFEVQPLMAVLLHKLRGRDRLLNGRAELQSCCGGTVRQTKLLHDRLLALDGLAERRFGVGRNVVGGHIHSAGQEHSCPAGANQSGADDGNTRYWAVCHDGECLCRWPSAIFVPKLPPGKSSSLRGSRQMCCFRAVCTDRMRRRYRPITGEAGLYRAPPPDPARAAVTGVDADDAASADQPGERVDQLFAAC